MIHPTLSEIACDYDEFPCCVERVAKWVAENDFGETLIQDGKLIIIGDAVDRNNVLVEVRDEFPITDGMVDMTQIARLCGF